MGGKIEPFAGGGVGLYYCKIKEGTSASVSGKDWTTGFFLGLGVNFNVLPNGFLGLEGKYFWAKPSFSGTVVKIDGINLTVNIGHRF